jgi:chaperonin GroEL
MEKPLFLIYDGIVSDLVAFLPVLEKMGQEYAEGNSDYRNLVFVSHGFSEGVLINLAMNFSNPNSMNIFPLVSPMNAVVNSQMNFLQDLAAFTGAKIFGMTQNVRDAQPDDFGKGMDLFESYRFRSTVVGEPDPMDIEVRADVLKQQLANPESIQAKIDLEERLGKLTTGISKLTIYAGSSGELKEKHDRAEDAICAVRASISNGVLPGGCRVLANLAKEGLSYEGSDQEVKIYQRILVPSLLSPLEKLLENAGNNKQEREKIMNKLWENEELVYDVENEVYGKAQELGIFDAAKAVSEALKNSFSIASTLGVIGGIVVYPRDHQLEREEASRDIDYRNSVDNPTSFADEVSHRI